MQDLKPLFSIITTNSILISLFGYYILTKPLLITFLSTVERVIQMLKYINLLNAKDVALAYHYARQISYLS